jgi:adenylate cyclase
LIDAYHQGREYYLNREFELAMAEFGKVLEIDQNNKAANLHMERCTHFTAEPPGDDWDGVWKLTEK